MKIGNINLIKSFLILLMLGIQNPAFSEEEVEPDVESNDVPTVTGVYVSRDNPSVILSIHFNEEKNSIVVIDVSGTLDFLRDIWYISEEEYEQNITVSPLERAFIGTINENRATIGLEPLVPESERSSKNSIGKQSASTNRFIDLFFWIDKRSNSIRAGFSREAIGIHFSYYRGGLLKIF
jgi:hypothetical protein